MKKSLMILALMACMGAISACSPEIGGEAWCKVMDNKSKADWSASEAADYAEHCVFD